MPDEDGVTQINVPRTGRYQQGFIDYSGLNETVCCKSLYEAKGKEHDHG